MNILVRLMCVRTQCYSESRQGSEPLLLELESSRVFKSRTRSSRVFGLKLQTESNWSKPNRTEFFFSSTPFFCCFHRIWAFKKSKKFFPKIFSKFFKKQNSFKNCISSLEKNDYFWLVNLGSNFERLQTSKTRYQNSSFRTPTKFGPLF